MHRSWCPPVVRSGVVDRCGRRRGAVTGNITALPRPSDDLRTVGAGALESHSRSFDHGVARPGCAPAMASALRCPTRHDKPTVFGVALWLRPVPGSVDDLIPALPIVDEDLRGQSCWLGRCDGRQAVPTSCFRSAAQSSTARLVQGSATCFSHMPTKLNNPPRPHDPSFTGHSRYGSGQRTPSLRVRNQGAAAAIAGEVESSRH